MTIKQQEVARTKSHLLSLSERSIMIPAAFISHFLAGENEKLNLIKFFFT